jgi:hypothetical protein
MSSSSSGKKSSSRQNAQKLVSKELPKREKHEADLRKKRYKNAVFYYKNAVKNPPYPYPSTRSSLSLFLFLTHAR